MWKSIFTKLMLFLAFSSLAHADCKHLADIVQGQSSKRDHVCDIFVPRNDLTVFLGSFIMDPELGIGLEISIIPIEHSKEKSVEGEIALLESEVQTATKFLKHHHFDITALHNHFILESPKILFLHFEKKGHPADILRELRHLANEIGDFGPRSQVFPTSDLNAHTLNRILKLKGKIQPGGAYVADFERPFKINDNGAISEPEGMIAIQGDAQNALIVGEVPVRVKEVQKFIKALEKEGLLFAALHNHELAEVPRVYYIHFEQFGLPADVLAHKAHAALKTIDIEKE